MGKSKELSEQELAEMQAEGEAAGKLPCWRYHPEHEARLCKTAAQLIAAMDAGFRDSLADFKSE